MYLKTLNEFVKLKSSIYCSSWKSVTKL